MDDDKERVELLTRFISSNYKNRISLTEISNMLFLSDAYLSKYIKKYFGMNFSDYLNTVRLNHAIEELLFTDSPIIRIALENGFASISTFNKVFKDFYEMTPSKYRAKYSKTKNNDKQNADDMKDVLKRAKELFGVEEVNKNVVEDNIQIVDIDTTNKKPLKKVWNEMINIGAAEEVLRSDLQKHILDIKSKLNIKYVRIWHLYSPAMLLDVNTKDNAYNFHKLDKVLDFLVDNDIYPYLELNTKSNVLIRSINKVLIPDNEAAPFENLKVFERFFNDFIIHIINRYGTENVSNWYFEYWKNERLIVEKIYNVIDIDNDKDYLDQFSIIYRTFKKYLPEVKIGGAGLSTRFGYEILYNTLVEWGKIKEQPDFLTFYSFPYIEDDQAKDRISKVSTNRNYLKDNLTVVKELVEKSGINMTEFHLSEWNGTVSNRNIFNDACYKGSYLMKNIIDNFDNLDVMGYWFVSDITADFFDSAYLINGGCGLITKDGINKPAFYAYDFLNRLGKKFVDKGENYLVSYNGYKEWGIVCHNYKFFNYQFFTTTEDEIDYKNTNKYFENNDDLEIQYNLSGVENGHYDVKVYSINSQQGSLQDEWLRMSCPANLTQQEIDYLKRICVPHINITTIDVQDGKLSFKTRLEANEIQYINIRYRLV
jgi:beta-xylosidase/AraC-like DNA-binding protein